jgi:hypothetical protein
MTGRVGPRIAMISAVLALVVGVAGVIVTLALGAFVFDDYDAYGEVRVPGSGRVSLPAGEVTISFHTAVTGGVGGGFPVPPLKLGIDPPEGVPDPVITETIGTTTSVNNDVHLRIWVAQIPRAGVYGVRTDGDVGGYINPRLSIGRDSSPGWPMWVFGALAAVGAVALAGAIAWRVRAGRRARPVPGPVILDEPNWPGPIPPPVYEYPPLDERGGQ